MSGSRLRQVARLEKRAVPYIKRMQEKREKSAASLRERAFVIVANLALLILFGDPRMGEPLSCAWQRCLESRTWKACREKHPNYIGQYGYEEASPFDRWQAGLIAQYFRKYFLPELPGADETEKLKCGPCKGASVVALVHPWGSIWRTVWSQSTGLFEQVPFCAPEFFFREVTGWTI
jgi:hypothetical protein